MDCNGLATASEVGNSLKTILERLKTHNFNSNNEEIVKVGCNHCKNFEKHETYDQQWGRYGYFYQKCLKGCNYKDTHICLGLKQCCEFECGDNKLINMSQKEKDDIENRFYR